MICKKRGATALVKLVRCIAAAAGLALPFEALADCDNTTLSGTYLFQDLWANTIAPECQFSPPGMVSCGPVPSTNTVKGTATFDGAGGAVFNLQVRHISRDVLTTSTISGPGTYTITPDCGVTITLPTGDSGLFLTVPSGNFFYETDPVGGLQANENFIGFGIRGG
jgi:hypothetical protein